MANPILSALRTEAQQYADAENDPHKSTAEWTTWLNAAGAELYDLLVSTFEDWYVDVVSSLTPSASTGVLTPGVEILKIRALEKNVGGSDWMRVLQTSGPERPQYRAIIGPVLSGHAADCVYDLQGQTIYILPSSSWSGTFRIWYVPTYAPMSADADYLFGSASGKLVPNQWHQYVTLGAAIRARMKEEGNINELAGMQAQVRDRIQSAARDRKGPGGRMRDVATHRDNPRRRWR